MTFSHLYPLRPPFTRLTLTPRPRWVEAAVEIDGKPGGSLHLSRVDTPEQVLQIFANTSLVVAELVDGTLEWHVSHAAQQRIEQVFDQEGNLLTVSALLEE